MKIKLKKYAMPLSIAGCLILIYLCTIVGITSIPFGEANRILLHEVLHLPVNMDGISAGNIAIIWNVRLPRVILGFLTGGALAVCGAAYQGIFKNPMADPFILGVSSGAALGASIGIVMHFSTGFLGLNGIAVLAFVGAFLAIFLVYNISKVGRKVPVASLLLSGIAVSQSLTAFMSLLMIFNVQSMNQIMFWTMGSLNGKGWSQVITVLPYVIIGCLILFTTVRELDIMLLGEDAATQLGVNTDHLKKKVLVVSSVITAAVVSVTGIIGFVGLVVPHIVRILSGPKHRILLPFSLVFGGTFLIICDTLARTVSSQEIPVGIITAAFGGPFFIYLLRKSKKGGTR
ncbi:iron chelate uptake ABC transporter family permease subunit [Eubacterium sp. 1001713B170207_170306_E7]|uniref:FecCD family ABC transporter permease n=1 Tax=Eubacterium sp. 1001713B170207_170306_E7 TaxID=2787097 RepID=UPI00189753FE|nr:iron chelate uptake ABC transporter family permease subunit [Eubacterium sp. 1001713B170207_170306_E7]